MLEYLLTYTTVVLEADRTYPLSYWPGVEEYVGPFLPDNTVIKQLPFYGTDDQLIAPWDMDRALRPGTLVIVRCSLVMWFWKNRLVRPIRIDGFGLIIHMYSQPHQHNYQLRIKRLDVIDSSMTDAESHAAQEVTLQDTTVEFDDAVVAAPSRASFVSPTKRRKTA